MIFTIAILTHSHSLQSYLVFATTSVIEMYSISVIKNRSYNSNKKYSNKPTTVRRSATQNVQLLFVMCLLRGFINIYLRPYMMMKCQYGLIYFCLMKILMKMQNFRRLNLCKSMIKTELPI